MMQTIFARDVQISRDPVPGLLDRPLLALFNRRRAPSLLVYFSEGFSAHYLIRNKSIHLSHIHQPQHPPPHPPSQQLVNMTKRTKSMSYLKAKRVLLTSHLRGRGDRESTHPEPIFPLPHPFLSRGTCSRS